MRSVSLRWVLSTIFSCFRKQFGLFFQGVLALVQQPLALVQFPPQLAEFLLALGLAAGGPLP